MNADTKYTSSFAGGYCLSTDALRQYIDGTLPKKSLHVVEKHLLDCDFCSTVLEDMDVTEDAEFSVQGITKNVNARISQIIGTAPKPVFWVSYGKYVKGAAVALVFLGMGLLYRFYNQAPSDASKSPSSLPSPTISQPTVVSADTSAKNIKEDEFVLAKKAEPKPTDEQMTSAATAVPVENKAAENKTDLSKTETAEEMKKKPEVLVSVPVKKTEPAVESPAEKENFADLQIVSAKVLQKMTKTEGSSRKGSKNGQLPTPNNRKTSYYLLEDMPAYPGGDNAMEEYLAANFKNPVKDKRKLTGPAVAVMFTVSSRGKISDVEITRSIGPELDVEIIRLISSMPQWDPGKHKGDITCVLALTVH